MPKKRSLTFENNLIKKVGYLSLLPQMWIVQESHQLIPSDGKL